MSKSFKISNLKLFLLYLCLHKSRCSKEIAKMIGKPNNDRNIQKAFLFLEKEGFMKEVNRSLKKYSKSRYFIVDKDRLGKLLIDYKKKQIERAKELAGNEKTITELNKIKLPTKEEAIKEFRNDFEEVVSNGKRIINYTTHVSPTGLRSFRKIAELIQK